MDESMLRDLNSRSTAHQLWALIVETKRVLHDRAVEAAGAAGLSPAAAWALIRLEPGAPISQRELAHRLHCAPSTVVDPTDKLEERGFVVRKVDPSDRRVNILVVTEEGRRMRERLVARLLEPPEPLKRLSPEDQATFRDAMRSVVLNPESEAPTPGARPAHEGRAKLGSGKPAPERQASGAPASS